MTAPRQLGSYVIDSEIGRGGMGVVYRARDLRLDRWVAIKMLPPELMGDPELLSRFEREARILAALHHPGIAGIHAIEDAGKLRFLAMEFVEGPTLAERIGGRPLPVSETVEIARQLATAIEAAHESGVIHRDLKPGNIKITPGGEVKVLDFGLARFDGPRPGAGNHSRPQEPAVSGTQLGAMIGTAGYMSPEQTRGQALDRRTDIWSFGCVLYECLTGQQAFGGETISDSIVRILEYEPDLAMLPAETPAPVVDLLERCLAKDPRHRLRDIGDARLALEKVLASRSASGRFPAAAARTAGKPARPSVPIAVTVLAVIGGIVLGLLAAPRVFRRAVPLRSLAIPMPPGHSIRNSVVTPDGRMVIVSAVPRSGADAESSAPRVLVRPIGSSEFRVLPQSLGVVSAALPPDGKSFLMVLPVPGTPQKRLVRVPLDGSAPPTPLADWGDGWNSMTVLTDGDVLVMEGATRLVRIPAGGGTPSAPLPIHVSDNVKVSQVELEPSQMPNGDPFVNVIAYDARGWHYNVGILDPRTGRVTIAVEDGGSGWYWSAADLLLFARGKSIFAARFDRAHDRVRSAPVAVWSGLRATLTRPGFFRVLDDGTLYHAPGGTEVGRMLAVLEGPGTITPLAGERRTFDDAPVPSPDGRRFACTVANGRGIDELWIGDVSRPSLTRVTTDPDADCSQPAWSPDGTRIAYKRQAQDARDGIYVLDVAGGTARRILKLESGTTLYRPQAWVAGGSALIATRQLPGRVSLVRIPVTSSEVSEADAKPVHESRSNEFSARVSPDGRALVYTSDESGRLEIYQAAVAGDGSIGAPAQISSSGGSGGQWAADGRSVFAVDPQNRIVEFPVGAGASAVPQVLYDMRQLNIATWAPLPGRRFLIGLGSEDERDIAYYTLVQGWMGEVERILRKKD